MQDCVLREMRALSVRDLYLGADLPNVQESETDRRYPKLIVVGTSATIKSMEEGSGTQEEIIAARDADIRRFFAALTGVAPETIRVLGEQLEDIKIPEDATYAAAPSLPDARDFADADAVRAALDCLSGAVNSSDLVDAARRCRLLWDINAWLIRKAMSISQIVDKIQGEVAERSACSKDDIRHEVETALRLGAVLDETMPGALRLKAHRFVRGGWQFHRCVDPKCGKLYPKGEERCECGHRTAPLFLCRNCGADYLRFVGQTNPDAGPLIPSAVVSENGDGLEWMLYDPTRLEVGLAVEEEFQDDEEQQQARMLDQARQRQPRQMRKRPVKHGSFDPSTLSFSLDETCYPLRVTLAPARTQCLSCGGTLGSRNVVTPVALGTSAAVKVLAEGLVDGLSEESSRREGHDGKERLLVFSDSRQDAAHQARFIIFASRYDRMRRRVVRMLEKEGPLSIQRIVELLRDAAIHQHDNPYVPEGEVEWVSQETQDRIQAWEEAPLLDELAVSTGYRGTLMNLGLVHVGYHRLSEYARARGEELATELGLKNVDQLAYICRCLLDEMRVRGCLSREMLRYHPLSTRCPEHIRAANWERRVKQPNGYAADKSGRPALYMEAQEVPSGIRMQNAWRKPKAGGRGPSIERIFKRLMESLGETTATPELLSKVLDFLAKGEFVGPFELFGARQSTRLIQANAGTVCLELATEDSRCRCEVCGRVMAGAEPGLPCPRCHGRLVRFSDSEVKASRTVKRIYNDSVIPLVAAEHTAQVTNDDRVRYEDEFKAAVEKSPRNLLACSPTLEMGIDVGGLDAIILRNIPPRPDNYAQRGGRSGRRSRVGLVVGYARKTPHDQYFYDKPSEMIAGEVPAPALGLGNRDVIQRHLHAIALGAADPGVAGRMVEYVSQTGEVKQEAVDSLIEAVRQQFGYAIALAKQAWSADILPAAQVDEGYLRSQLDQLPNRIQNVIERTARQVAELRIALDQYARELVGARAGQRAGELAARLLGIPTDNRNRREADDRSAGYPLRRFAEFGILPGYEFPSEPATLRLLGDSHEEEPVSTVRRHGINQFAPDAQVYARTLRWKVVGIDSASPWNPRSDEVSWRYRICRGCELRYGADEPRCPRCSTDLPGPVHAGMEYAGFLAKRDEGPILDEEDRIAMKDKVRGHPQWDGQVIGRWSTCPGWGLRLSRDEQVQWINENVPPRARELEAGIPCLHDKAKGFYICTSCWRLLAAPEPVIDGSHGRRRTANTTTQGDPYKHADGCPQAGSPPKPVAIVTDGRMELLRLIVPVPKEASDLETWGYSLAFALRRGMIRQFALSEADIGCEFEGAWETTLGDVRCTTAAITFIDPNLGGSGYLVRIAEAFNLVAAQAIEHLDHTDCDSSCYRCLKSYDNQRHHDFLIWPRITDDLESLAAAKPESRPVDAADIDDPKPWLEAYAAGVGSPLELKFLRLFEEHGLKVEKQVPVSPSDATAPISVADFAIPEKRLAIYVDGASFHTGSNLRRDRFIRNRLRSGSPPWNVIELRAADLSRGTSLVEELRRLIA